MTDDSTLVDIDLDTFSDTFFGKEEVKPEAEPEPEQEEVEAEDEVETGDDTPATEETEAEEETPEDEEEEAERPKPEKKSAQARINEVVAKQRAAERERDALAARIRELEAAPPKPEEKQNPGPIVSPDGPQPDAVNEDGTPKYKLGEFDPIFIQDLTRHTIKVEREEAQKVAAQEEQRKMVEAAQAELTSSWLQKVDEVEKELPDLREKIGEMEAAFSGIDPNYGEFLAGTIMACDNGPEIMYYLSQNIGEAQKIVASGPAAATLALGRLDAKFVKAAKEEKRNKKPSSAPAPAPQATRGQGGRFSTPGDTNDLSAFEREYFQKK